MNMKSVAVEMQQWIIFFVATLHVPLSAISNLFVICTLPDIFVWS